jgi:hypothetical protein
MHMLPVHVCFILIKLICKRVWREGMFVLVGVIWWYAYDIQLHVKVLKEILH